MKVYVNTKKVRLEKNYIINRGEYRANPLEFEFSDEYENLIKKVRFVNDKETIENTITNDVCYIPETMSSSKKFELRVYAYEMQGDDLILRYSPTYAKVFTREGSYQSDATPIEIEKLNIVPMQREQNFKGLYDEVNVEAIQSDELNITPSNEEQTFTGLYNTVSVEAIPPIEAETLNATSSTQNQSFSGLYDEVNIAGIQTDTLNVTPSQTQQQFTGLYDTVNVGAIQAESLSITPTKEAQTRTGLYNQVNVSGDNSLVASNIKKDVSIFGVTGSYEETPSLQSKTITITENGTQTVTPDSGYDGLSSVAITTNVSGSGDEWYIDNAAYLFTEGTRLNSLSNLLPLIKNATNAKQMFNACRNVQTLDLTSFDTAGIKYMNEMFQYCTKLTGVTIGDKWDMSSVEDANSMFYNCSNLTYEGVDWSKFDTRRLINCSTMFARCEKLVTAPVLDLSAVTTQSGMFSGCYALKNVPAYSIPNAMSTLYNMFQSCSQLTEESLNNILAICISAVKITGSEKTLQRMGITSSQATVCQGLSNYQAFLDAGWTTGY